MRGRDQDRVKTLLKIGAALSSESNIDLLLEMILLSAKQLTDADGGTLYLVTEGGDLNYEMLHTSSLGFAMGGSTGAPIQFPPVSLAKNTELVSVRCALEQRSITISDVYTNQEFDFGGSSKFDSSTGYCTRSMLCVPLVNHLSETVGVIQLINSVDTQTGAVVDFSAESQQLAESLASQAAIALSNRQLINQLAELFEALIGMINTAIDEKSPYTGGHCNRVPDLALMLAEAVDKTSHGPLSEFSMSEEDRYELRIASLLHDCGKVTTPVHVVDKGTKLETIFDRIALIDTRFEVLRRDREIAFLKGELSEVDYQAANQQIDEARDFLRHCNVGGERMRDEDIARVKAIAAWKLTGPNGHPQTFLSDDEVENLTIVAGTLTFAERQIINNHIVSTIKMLEALPWPKHLRRVPEFAGGHHERMDGKGYPKGLTRDEMSLQARIMGIADIFEALTAADRPYKAAKPLSEALKIMGFFKLEHHIDPDLFDVFIREKVYLDYAQRYLAPDQIDAIDESKIPGFASAL